MKKAGVNLYNIILAKDLSKRLTDRGDAPVRKQWMEDESEYTRFPSSGVPEKILASTPQAPPITLPTQPDEPELGPVPMEFVTWRDMLGWCREAADARAAFILDVDGFVVANMGEEPVNGFDGMGAELVYSMDHLDRVDAHAGTIISVDLQFKDRSVYGFRIRINEAVQLVMGLICDGELRTDIKNWILDVAYLNLAKLT